MGSACPSTVERSCSAQRARAPPFAPNLEKGKAAAGEGAAVYTDFRRLLDDKTIDLVINATPDHWHAVPTVMVCQAGKDVYVERSNAHFQQAAQIVRQGLLGARSASMSMDELDDGLHNHAGNLLECVKTRQRPAADIETGQHSSATCLLGVVALRTRERIEFDPVRQELKNGSPAARRLFAREYRLGFGAYWGRVYGRCSERASPRCVTGGSRRTR